MMAAGLSGLDAPIITSRRIPALDSLRGMAILSVFAYHAFPWSGLRVDGGLSRAVFVLSRPGWVGVDLFFVLSGFLITGRLLDRRATAAREYYTWFYKRRALRILPLYYAALAVIGSIVWRAGETSGSFLWASAFFMPNIALLSGLLASAPLAVLWSLGIEEQVYLVWPWLVRSVTIRTLALVFVGVGLAEPVLRAAAFASGGVMRDGLSLATWLRLDGFAWGGLLAVLARDVRVSRRRLGAMGAAALAVSSGLAALCAATGNLSQRTMVGASLQFACVDLFFAGLVAVSLTLAPQTQAPPRRSLPALLASFGRISYCLYLVHLFVFWAFDRFAGVEPPIALGPAALRALIVLAVCTIVAELSWRFLEAPSLERGIPAGENAVAGPA